MEQVCRKQVTFSFHVQHAIPFASIDLIILNNVHLLKCILILFIYMAKVLNETLCLV